MTTPASTPVAPGFLRRPSWVARKLGPAWPLKALLLGLPLFWVLGMASLAYLLAAVPMALHIRRCGRLRTPAGFGFWVLFLAWMLAGVFVLWAHAPGTIDGGGIERLAGFGYRVVWYAAVTVAMLYPLSFTSRELPGRDVARWLGTLFLVCVGGGLAGLAFPSLEFTSPIEILLGSPKSGFLQALAHPSLTTASDFLGYEQPRPKAPFAYPNAWGNNTGLLMPFFVYSWLTSPRQWQRYAVPLVLALAALPIAASLNRGLWLGLCLLLLYTFIVLARARRMAALWGLVLCVGLAAILVVASPLWSTITLRLETPHSNERRGTVAEVVTETTWQGSPLLGFGTTRKVDGSFSSIAGGETPDCRQCAAPPLGTQGFMWRLVFTTGFVGTALFLFFMAVQILRHFRRRDGLSVLGCMTLSTSMLYFFVYDSLESPMFILMLALGLMNRERLEEAAGKGLRGPSVPSLQPVPAGALR